MNRLHTFIYTILAILFCTYLLLKSSVQGNRQTDGKSRSRLASKIENHQLLVDPVDEITVESELDCMFKCTRKTGCQSFDLSLQAPASWKCFLLSSDHDKHSSSLVARKGYDHYYFVDPFVQPEIEKPKRKDFVFVFTTLGAKGSYGPNNTRGYEGTNLEELVTLENGKQLWIVPQTAVYSIEAYGASGANSTCRNDSEECHQGGLGARIMGSFNLTKDTMLTILVGQQDQLTTGIFIFVDGGVGGVGGGGGGGSFVVHTSKQLPLVVAGGGGGGGGSFKGFEDGDPGQANENGSRCGGFGGKGGKLCNTSGAEISDLYTGSGAGFRGDGVCLPPKSGFAEAQSFTNGGLGARIKPFQVMGGFGGGGYGLWQGGGGGGYSGGGVIGGSYKGTAGGGGSFNSGTSQENQAGINYGDGKVIIKMA